MHTIWKSPAEICALLEISPKHLSRLRQDGFLKQGRHWRNIARPNAQRPTYRYHVKRCEAALEIPTEAR